MVGRCSMMQQIWVVAWNIFPAGLGSRPKARVLQTNPSEASCRARSRQQPPGFSGDSKANTATSCNCAS